MKSIHCIIIALASAAITASAFVGCGSTEKEAPAPGKVEKVADTAAVKPADKPAAKPAEKPSDKPASAAAAAAAKPGMPSVEETRALAEEAFIYGLPLVMGYAVMYEYAVDKDSGQYKAPFNQIKNEARVFTYEDTAIITPNSDTPYSFAWCDLRAEPVVISVPAVEKSRYYSVMLEDLNTFINGYIGSRATGSEAGSYLYAGPDWKGATPAGIKKTFTATTQFAIIGCRTQLFDAADMDKVKAVQAGYKVQPLSAFLKQPAPTAAPKLDFPKINKELAQTNFFTYLDFVLGLSPPGPEETAARARIAKLGIGPGKTFDFKDLPAEQKAAVVAGVKSGAEKIEQWLLHGMKSINGWSIGSFFGDRAFYKGDWLMRASAAKGGLYGNSAEEAMYPFAKTMPDGQLIDCSKHDYTLTFPKGQQPPVNAFWSVTMYDGKTQFLIKNPINRYLINSPMLPGMKTGADGSLTLYIQKDSPGKDKESNWLPAADGPVYLVMRLYWPKVEKPSILPAGEGSWKPPALVVAK